MSCNCDNNIKHKDRDEQEKKDLIKRLNRIEGQVRGVKNMIEEDRYCVDVLTQVSAVSAALDSFSRLLLNNHVKSCVVRDIREGKDEVVDELMDLLKKIM